MGFLGWVGAWYLLSGRSKMIDRAEVLPIVQAAWEVADDKDEMAEGILELLGYRRR